VIASILVANRGEIAVRVIRGAAELGVRTIGVYSEIDREAMHVAMADEAWNIGPAPASESYLNVERILEVASEAGAEAIHPGYGFLAENADFAKAVTEAGLIWVGAPPNSIRLMGDKVSSRRVAATAGVPTVPGTTEAVTDPAVVVAFGKEHGWPLAIKASAGGGGRGMRVVHGADEVEAALESAAREADAYFADPSVYVEKYLEHARHIEAQVLFDTMGNGVFVGERDCSMQRRHQKLIEEAPSTVFDDAARKAFGDAAIALGTEAAYEGAGTVEFLVDRGGNFYFLEMNTRLQVEHPVTEMTTGIDLVAEQLRIAAGEKLRITETPPAFGHAIEFRINAENPAAGFVPDPGIVVDYESPGGFGVRVDDWVRPGTRVSQYYDNLLGKLIVWGGDRSEAIARGRRALSEFRVSGIATTIPAHLRILEHPAFVASEHHTKTVETELDFSDIPSPTAPAVPADEELSERALTVEIGGRHYQVRVWAPEMAARSDRREAPRRRPPKLERLGSDSGSEPGVITAPMQGTIIKVSKKAGDTVAAGDSICVLEAMKMENDLKSSIAGELVDLRVNPGDTVATGQVLAVVR
jgi:acetyl-CoA/propionyl-CoA carboxylase biotin carboxyl carrier protein